MRGAQGGMDTGWGEGEAQEPGREKGGECMVTESGNARRLEMLRFQKFRLLKSQNIRIPESKKPRIFELGSVRSGSPPALQGKTHIFHSTPPPTSGNGLRFWLGMPFLLFCIQTVCRTAPFSRMALAPETFTFFGLLQL